MKTQDFITSAFGSKYIHIHIFDLHMITTKNVNQLQLFPLVTILVNSCWLNVGLCYIMIFEKCEKSVFFTIFQVQYWIEYSVLWEWLTMKFPFSICWLINIDVLVNITVLPKCWISIIDREDLWRWWPPKSNSVAIYGYKKPFQAIW